MNRHTRRADLAHFRRDAHRGHLTTFLIAADDDVSLDRMPMLSRAVRFWRAGIEQRRPWCPACKGNFADDAKAAAFLFAVPSLAPTSASVSAICTSCWNGLPPDDIEREVAKVLRQLIPHGRFLDAQR
jgi:hypothetical protein